ncbi:hypothetical protein N3C_2150 [Clostridium sp. N3C]|nr:hypothetical protein N3C_2150 [Clostridium sp. N3C]
MILKGLKTILKIILIKQWKSEMNSYPLTLETLPCSSCTLPLFRTDFILKNVTRNKEKVLINGMKIWNFRADFIIWKRLGE